MSVCPETFAQKHWMKVNMGFLSKRLSGTSFDFLVWKNELKSIACFRTDF